MMWPTLLLGLLVASVAGWIITAWFQIRRIRRLERSHEEIQVEETLVFDFLHGLGEAFRETIRPQDLHRLIVDCGCIAAVWKPRSRRPSTGERPYGPRFFPGGFRRF